MGDVISFKSGVETPLGAAEQLVENIAEGDLTCVGLIVNKDGEITITSSPISTERMHYLGGILMNYSINGPI